MNTNSVARILTKRSRLEPASMEIGRIVLLTPRIRKVLKIFDPMIFPIEISTFFLNEKCYQDDSVCPVQNRNRRVV